MINATMMAPVKQAGITKAVDLRAQSPAVAQSRGLATSPQMLSCLLRSLVRMQMISLEQAMDAGRHWRRATGKTWNAAPYETWSQVSNGRVMAKIFFRHLRENLAGSDYRAALLAARKEVSGLRQRIAAEEAG